MTVLITIIFYDQCHISPLWNNITPELSCYIGHFCALHVCKWSTKESPFTTVVKDVCMFFFCSRLLVMWDAQHLTRLPPLSCNISSILLYCSSGDGCWTISTGLLPDKFSPGLYMVKTAIWAVPLKMVDLRFFSPLFGTYLCFKFVSKLLD